MRSRMSATHELPTAELPEGAGDTSEETTLTRLEIEQALGRLSAADRLMVRLRYEGDLTNPAIASTLGLSVANVKVRLHRLRKSLEETLPSS